MTARGDGVPWPHRLSQQLARLQKPMEETERKLRGVHRLEVRAVATLAQINGRLRQQAEQIEDVVRAADHVEKVMDRLVAMAVELRDGLAAAVTSGDANELATVQAQANGHLERVREEWEQLTSLRAGTRGQKIWPPRKDADG